MRPTSTAAGGAVRTLGRRYRLDAPLGTGGMAEVWRARDLVLGRDVAVKLLLESFAGPGARDARGRIRAEAQVAARLAHPNVASVFDFGESRQRGRGRVPYIVMELVHGDTLAVRQQGDRMHWRTAVGISAQVAAALAAAHACGVVHRDIKPGNVMLARTGVKVVDFGIAAAVGALDEADGELYGTPAFVAPERFAGKPAAPATDVYALGILLYQCLTGTLPWPVRSITELVRAHREEPPAPLPPVDGLPADVAELCEQCLSKDPDERPSSLYAAVVLADAAGLPVTLPPVASAAAVPAVAAPAVVVADVPTGAMASEPPPAAPVRPRLPRRPRVRSHAAPEGRRRAMEQARRFGLGRGGWLGPGGRLRLGRWSFAPRVTGAAVAALVGVAGLAAAVATHLARAEDPAGHAATPAGGCSAQYVANAGADGAFTAEVAVTNTGAARLDRWSLEFALPDGQRITDVRGLRWNQRGDAVTLHGSAPLAVGDTQRLSLTGTSSAQPLAPTRFTLDGAACTRSAVVPPR